MPPSRTTAVATQRSTSTQATRPSTPLCGICGQRLRLRICSKRPPLFPPRLRAKMGTCARSFSSPSPSSRCPVAAKAPPTTRPSPAAPGLVGARHRRAARALPTDNRLRQQDSARSLSPLRPSHEAARSPSRTSAPRAGGPVGSTDPLGIPPVTTRTAPTRGAVIAA